jgi:hypothetical protein
MPTTCTNEAGVEMPESGSGLAINRQQKGPKLMLLDFGPDSSSTIKSESKIHTKSTHRCAHR